ncbi:VanZ family protein [Sporosarcina thermotolerans]
MKKIKWNNSKLDYVMFNKKNSKSKGEAMWLISMYVIEMLSYMVVALPIYVLIRTIIIKRKKLPVNKLHELLLALFILYLVGLASQTIIPKWSLSVDGSTGKFYFDVYSINRLSSVNLIPLRTILNYFQVNEHVSGWSSVSLVNLLGNMFVFSPIGFFIPLLWSRMDSFKSILFIGFGVTCFIEGTQYFIGRSTDIDDIILNTIGVIIGYGVYLVWKILSVREKTVD